jgi:NAD(P)-dependent dehydrogenase (short-subunit alcohol dehydrogenase family)
MTPKGTPGSAIVIGAGPGIGAAVARKLSGEGLTVGVIARSRATLDDTSFGKALGLTADVTDEAGLRGALDQLVERNGVPSLLVYNAALIQWDPFGELSARQQLDAYAVNVVGAITAIAHLAPRMADAGSGTILLTGGMPDPIPEETSLSLGKAGVRALASLLAKAYGPSGVHVATVTIAGAVSPGSAFDPEKIAERYWQIHLQPAGEWQEEVLYAGSK